MNVYERKETGEQLSDESLPVEDSFEYPELNRESVVHRRCPNCFVRILRARYARTAVRLDLERTLDRTPKRTMSTTGDRRSE